MCTESAEQQFMREVGISFIVQGTLVEPVSVQEVLNSALWAKCGSVVHFSFWAKGATTTEQNYSVLTSAAIIISLFFVFVFCFVFVFVCFFFAVISFVPTSEVLLSHCSSQHPYLRPHPRFIPYRGPAPRGLEEETSDQWWAVIPRRHCNAARLLRWCSMTPVLIQHPPLGHPPLCPPTVDNVR